MVGVILTFVVRFGSFAIRLVTPQRRGLVVSPADGVVNMITEAEPLPELGLGDEALPRISVFMNAFNCHVNRMPVSGKVVKSLYRTGQFLSADLDKAAEANERQSLLVEAEGGKQIVAVQIAGLVARRIILCFAHEEQEFHAGERFGLIRFGSRCDAVSICRRTVCRALLSVSRPLPVKPCWRI